MERNALNQAKSNPPPDAILSLGDIAEFADTPYFPFQDLDIDTVLHWLEKDEKSYMFDHIPGDLLRKRMERQIAIFNSAAAIFVPSEWIAESVRNHIENGPAVHTVGIGHRYHVSTVSNEVIADRFRNKRLLFVGIDGQRKGLDLVVEAFKHVTDSFPLAELTIVTDTTKMDDYYEQICSKSPQITLLDPLSADDLDDLYRSHSFFVMPSRFEPWGKVFFEAMSFGLPVIGAKRCAMPEFIRDGENGYTVALESRAISERIIRAFSNRSIYNKLSKNALSTAELYTWNKVLDKMLKIIDQNTNS